MKANSTTGSGISFPMLLGLAFVILKLCNVIHWAWLWVLAPFWIPLPIAGIVFIIYLIAPKKKSKQIEPPKSRWMQRYEQTMAARQKLWEISEKQESKKN